MVLDKTLVDTSGTTCNKVGVSYTAFRHQANACSQLPMSCLQNQLEDYHNEDIENLKKGLRAKYFLSGYGDFEMSKVDGQNKLFLSYMVDYIENSVVTLYVQGSSLKYILNKATGTIEKAWVDEFESLTKNGILNVHVKSTGNVQATFYVHVGSCSPNINPINSKSMAIEPSQVQAFVFSITTNSGLESSNSCEGTSLLSIPNTHSHFGRLHWHETRFGRCEIRYISLKAITRSSRKQFRRFTEGISRKSISDPWTIQLSKM
jgi:hypothetical protein